MARNQRPSFLKRQKEQKRLARAAEKRESRRLKKEARAAGGEDSGEPEEMLDEFEEAGEPAPDDASDQT